MKILVISQYFWPENFRINDLCAELTSRGHDITVLTGAPNYPEGNVFKEYKNDRSNYLFYKGCKVVRVPIVPRGSGGNIKLALNYLSYFLFASTYGLFKLRKEKFDLVFICQLSPVTIALPGILYKKIYKVPVIMWVLDLWPDTLEALGVVRSKKALMLISKIVSFIYGNCDYILGQSESFRDGIGKYCDDLNKIKYFPSWAEDIFSVEGYKSVNDISQFDDSFKILFAGNVGECQDFPSILKAASQLKNENKKIKFFVVGDGRMFEWVKDKIIEGGLDRYIYLLGRHSLNAMPDFYNSADALLVSLQKNKIFSWTIPGKLQSYLVAGKPILGMLDGEGARVINKANAGYVCDSGDAARLAENAISMSELRASELKDMGENGREYANTEFNREKLVSQLEGYFKTLADSRI